MAKFNLFECETAQCSNLGRQWVVERAEVTPGLLAISDNFHCDGCGEGVRLIARGVLTDRFGDF